MNCHICGGALDRTVTDLPFKLDNNSIVIVKMLPVMQCRNCSEYLIDDPIMARIDEVLEKINKQTELEIVRYDDLKIA